MNRLKCSLTIVILKITIVKEHLSRTAVMTVLNYISLGLTVIVRIALNDS